MQITELLSSYRTGRYEPESCIEDLGYNERMLLFDYLREPPDVFGLPWTGPN